jgi:hypothetical protein
LIVKRGVINEMAPGSDWLLSWKLEPDMKSPIAEVGVEISSDSRVEGIVYLDYLTWEGTPELTFGKPSTGGNTWQQAWVNAVNNVNFFGGDMPTFRIIQNTDTGMLIQGTREWKDYTFNATVNSHLASSTGIAVCVQGLKRYYALLLCKDQKLCLIKELDGRSVLLEKDFSYELDHNYQMSLQTKDSMLIAKINGEVVFEYNELDRPLLSGSIALVCEEGRVDFGQVSIKSND